MTTKSKKEIHLQEILTAAYHSYGRKLTTHAFLKVHNRTTSEDLVQDTFMKTWAYLLKKGEISAMKSFLYHVLNNLVVDEYRKQKTSSLDVLLEAGFEPSSDSHERFVDVLDGKALLLLMQHLPEKYQKVMRMRYVQDLTLQEMSLITSQTKNSLAVQLHRGLGKLKVLYETKAPLPPPQKTKGPF